MPAIVIPQEIGHGTCDTDGNITVIFLTGSDNVFTNNKQSGVANVTTGQASCGHSTIARSGSPSVFINNEAVHRVSDIGNLNPVGSYIALTGSQNVFVNEPGPAGSSMIAGEVIFSDGDSVEATKDLIHATGSSVAANDSAEEHLIPPLTPPPVPVISDDTPPVETPPIATNCVSMTVPDYDFQLSAHVKLRNVSVSAVYKHPIVSQHGLSISDIICNLKAVCENCFEPIIAQYPGARINSGFRRIGKNPTNSQHTFGEALDIQWPGINYDQYWERIHWIKNNIPYDQLLYEYGTTVWIHVSFKRSGNRPASASNKILTMVDEHFVPGLHRYR